MQLNEVVARTEDIVRIALRQMLRNRHILVRHNQRPFTWCYGVNAILWKIGKHPIFPYRFVTREGEIPQMKRLREKVSIVRCTPKHDPQATMKLLDIYT